MHRSMKLRDINFSHMRKRFTRIDLLKYYLGIILKRRNFEGLMRVKKEEITAMKSETVFLVQSHL